VGALQRRKRKKVEKIDKNKSLFFVCLITEPNAFFDLQQFFPLAEGKNTKQVEANDIKIGKKVN
jgi:hypothetical protein